MNNAIDGRRQPAPDLAEPLARLRRDEPPAADLWPAITARIAGADRPGRLDALRADVAPARELWPQIEARIGRQRARRVRAPWIAAAGLAASLVLALGLEVALEQGPGSPARAPIRASPEFAALSADPAGAMPALRRVSARPLTPETRALLRANLKIVANAEVQLKRAREADPDSAYLDSLLSTTRQQKQDLRYALAER